MTACELWRSPSSFPRAFILSVVTRCATAAIADIKTACDTLVATETLKFVTNVRPLEEFDDFVAELKKLGAEKIEEIYQKAYLNSLK